MPKLEAKGKLALERTDAWGDSMLHPPSDFFPQGLTPDEERWLMTALALDFEGRDIVLEQIACSRARREVDSDSVLVSFEGIRGVPKFEFPFFPILSLVAYRQDAPYVSCDLNSFRGQVDSMFVYTPDGSDLSLGDILLDDVEYWIPSYASQATSEMEDFYLECGSKRLRDFAAVLSVRAKDRRDETLRIMYEIAESVDGFVAEGLGPLSASIGIDLGTTERGSYEAIVQVSLVGDYFVSYPVLNGTDSPFPGYGGKLMHFWDYPNGHRFGELRRRCYERGLKPLTYSMVQHGMVTLASERKKRMMESSRLFAAMFGGSQRRLLDCYFTGENIL